MQGLFCGSSPACVDLGLTAPLSPRERREQMKPFILAKNLFFGSIPISLQRGGRRRARCACHARRQRVGTEGMPIQAWRGTEPRLQVSIKARQCLAALRAVAARIGGRLEMCNSRKERKRH